MADNEPVSIRDLVKKIAETVGALPPRLSIPFWIIFPVSLAVEMGCKSLGKEPPISRRSLNFFTGITSFDISKARIELGFRPKTSLEEGLKLTHYWMLSKGKIK